MADIVSTAVTVTRSWTEGHVTGKDRRGCVVVIAGTFTAGGTTNKITASALGFTKIESCSNGVLDDNSLIYILSPSSDGTFIVLTRTEGATGIPVDVTVTSPRTLILEVHGF